MSWYARKVCRHSLNRKHKRNPVRWTGKQASSGTDNSCSIYETSWAARRGFGVAPGAESRLRSPCGGGRCVDRLRQSRWLLYGIATAAAACLAEDGRWLQSRLELRVGWRVTRRRREIFDSCRSNGGTERRQANGPANRREVPADERSPPT